MSILPILQVGVLVLDIIFFVFLGLNLLIGFLKGWRKSTLNVLAFLIPFLLIICFRGVIANIVLNIDIPEVGTLHDLISTEVAGSLYPEGTTSPELISLCESVATSVINLAVYIVGLIIALLLSFVFKIIFGLTLKKFIYASTDGVKAAPSASSRLFGLIPGFVHFLTAMILVFFPIAGVMNVCNMAIEDVSMIQTMMPEDDSQHVASYDDLLDEINKGLDESITSKIINLGKNKDTGVSLAGSYLGSLITIKTEDAKVNIIDEYGRIRQVIPVASKIMDQATNNDVISLNNISQSDVKKITNIFEETEIIKLIAPAATEYLVYEISKDENNKEIVDVIKTIDIIEELNTITDVVVEVINTCSDLEIDLNAVQDVLLNESLPNHIDSIMDKTFKSDVINYIAMPYAIELIQDSIPEEYNDLLNILTEENIKNCLQSDVSKLLTVYQNLAQHNNLHNYLFKDEEVDFTSDNALANIENSIVDLFSISIVQGNETQLIKVALDAANVEGLTYDTLFNGVEPNWNEEVRVLAGTLKAALVVANSLDVFNNLENLSIEMLIQKDENGNFIIEEILNEIANSNVFKNIILNYIDTLELDEASQEILDIINLDEIRNLAPEDFKNEFSRLLNILDILVEMNIFNDEEVKLNKDSIKILVNNVFESIFIKGRENSIIEFALKQASVEGLTYENLIGEYVPNWSNEKTVLASVLSDIISLIEENDIKDSFSLELIVKRDSNGEYIFKPIISDISKSELLKQVLVNYISTFEFDEEAKEMVDLLNIEVIRNISPEDFEHEFIGFLDIIDIALNMNLIGEEEIIVDEASIKSLINTIFDSIFIKGNEEKIIDYILKATGLNTTLEENNIVINYTNVNWKIEKDNMIDIFTSIIDLQDIESFDIATILQNRTDETTNKIISLISALGKSQLFKDAMFDMIETMVHTTGYEIKFSDIEREQIIQNTWEVETRNLIDLIDFCTEKLGETSTYNTISGAEITNVMTKASSTIIATKVLGTVLNEMLGKDFLAINPILSDGSYKYDFTLQSTLESTAKDIGALVDLKNHAQNLDMTDISKATESVDNIVESIKILDESGLAKDMIQEVIGEDSIVDLDQIDLSKEAETIQKVYEVYKEDHENFDIEEHPELKEELEESDLAKTILDMLGIVLN